MVNHCKVILKVMWFEQHAIFVAAFCQLVELFEDSIEKGYDLHLSYKHKLNASRINK